MPTTGASFAFFVMQTNFYTSDLSRFLNVAGMGGKRFQACEELNIEAGNFAYIRSGESRGALRHHAADA